MKLQRKTCRRIAYIVLLALLLSGNVSNGIGAFFRVTQKASAAYEITMTSYYNNPDEVQKGTKVTISTAKEFLYLRQLIEEERDTAGIYFCQKADIKLADFSAEYLPEAERMVLSDAKGNVIVAIAKDGCCYKDATSSEEVQIEDTEISQGVFVSKYGTFEGFYEGYGYTIEGIVLLLNPNAGEIVRGEISFDDVGGIFGYSSFLSLRKLKLKNLCYVGQENGAFTTCNYGYITDCDITQSNICLFSSGGGLAKKNVGVIEDVDVSDTNIWIENDAAESYTVGGLVGENIDRIYGCCIDESSAINYLSGSGKIGGIAGEIKDSQGYYYGKNGEFVWGGAEYTDIVYTSNCADIRVKNGIGKIGGIVGSFSGKGVVSGCENQGDILCNYSEELSGEIELGGIAGWVSCTPHGDIGAYEGVMDCTENYGKIHYGEQYLSEEAIGTVKTNDGLDVSVGGIVGKLESPSLIQKCKNHSEVLVAAPLTGKMNAGGVVGTTDGNVEIRNSENNGNVDMVFTDLSTEGQACGGIVGKCDNASNLLLNNCFNTGDIVTGKNYALESDEFATGIQSTRIGGIVGAEEGTVEAGNERNNCYNMGEIFSTGGSLVGQSDGGDWRGSYYIGQQELEFIGSGEDYLLEDCLVVSDVEELVLLLNENQEAMNEKRGALYYLSFYIDGDNVARFSVDEEPCDIGRIPEHPVHGEPEETTATPTPPSTPTPTPTITPTVSPSVTPTTTPKSDSELKELQNELVAVWQRNLSGQKCSLKVLPSLKVKVTWKKNSSATGYIVYRSLKKTSGFKKIAKTGVGKLKYTDKKAKKGKKYYYKVIAYKSIDGKIVMGTGVVKKVRMPYYKAPNISLKKKVSSSKQKYIQLSLKKAKGSRIEVYIKRKGKSYTKVSLKSDRLSAYRGKINLSYSWKNVKVYFKVRTFSVKKGKKKYSAYSAQKKIKL